MTDKPKNPFEEWFDKAGEDELSTGTILHEGGAPSTARFFSGRRAQCF